MKILFLRESEGVYQFGQSKVHVKVENGNQVHVRIGGGFLSVEKFIEIYTRPQVKMIQRNDVIKKFHNKLQAQKIG
jgi:hypothetical protein